MYESFYRLTQRPFAAAPDPTLVVETPAVADALTRLERCVRQARGVGVLSGVAGIGKTHLLHRLALRLEEEFGVIRVPNAGFPSPRGLLQCLLAACGEGYERLGETELRLRLTAAAINARATTRGIVLLLDEAHRYSDRLLEEVRLTANQIESGEPLFRVIVAGQIELEDRLAEGGQSGLNERIGELVTLPRLTAEESRAYLAIRAAQAEGDLDELFEAAAVDIMTQACGGIPRCLNQLADHALLLGSVAERSMVSERLVREALEDLKRLPLQWHDPRPAVTGRGGHGETGGEGEGAGESFDSVVEIGSLDGEDDYDAEYDVETFAESPANDWDEEQETFESEAPRGRAIAEVQRQPEPPSPAPPVEPISDRFARLDATEAERRWLESWDETTKPDEAVVPPAGEEAIETVGPSTLETRCMELEETGGEAVCGTSESLAEPRRETEMDHEPVERSPARGGWHAAPKSATLFRDLRRRQGLS